MIRRFTHCALIVAALAVTRSAIAVACPTSGRYPVKIDSAPRGAAIYIGDKSCQIGVTPWEGKLDEGDYVAIVDLAGYEATQKPIHIDKLREQQWFFVQLAKKADPPKIDVRVEADPANLSGASLVLDGQPVGQAPMVIPSTAGRHQLEVKKPGFDTYAQTVDLSEGKTLIVFPHLQPTPPAYGTLIVGSDIPDGDLIVDGQPYSDHTPTVIPKVREGSHVVEVRKAGCLPWKQTVQVAAGRDLKLHAQLVPLVDPPSGDLPFMVRLLDKLTSVAELDHDDCERMATDFIAMLDANRDRLETAKTAIAADTSSDVRRTIQEHSQRMTLALQNCSGDARIQTAIQRLKMSAPRCEGTSSPSQAYSDPTGTIRYLVHKHPTIDGAAAIDFSAQNTTGEDLAVELDVEGTLATRKSITVEHLGIAKLSAGATEPIGSVTIADAASAFPLALQVANVKLCSIRPGDAAAPPPCANVAGKTGAPIPVSMPHCE